MKFNTDAPKISPQIGGTQPSIPLNRTSSGEAGAVRSPGSYELSGLTSAKRPSQDIGLSTDQSAKRPRQNAILPSRPDQLAAGMPAQASQISAISSTSAAASPLGGGVIDVPGLQMYSKVPTKEQASAIESKIKSELEAKHGPVQVFGYHVTTQENAASIRNQGFSSEANHGLGGGVAGMNIHGSGLYTSTRPVDDYVKADKTNVMYAVVAPKDGFNEGANKIGKSWDNASNAASANNGDFVTTMGDRKVNPSAISKVALVPIATIPPSMSAELLAMQPGASNRPAPLKTVPAEVHDFIAGAVENHPAEVKAINEQQDPDKKLDQIIALKDQIKLDSGMPQVATDRLLMMGLKQRYPLPS